MDASGSSDPDGDTISYTWKQVAGTAVTLSAPGAMNPAFTAPTVAAGTTETLAFELTVTDAGQLQATNTCDVQVVGEELPPVEEPPVIEPPVEEPPVVQPPADDDDHNGDCEDEDDDESRDDRHDNRSKERGKQGNRHHKHHHEYDERN